MKREQTMTILRRSRRREEADTTGQATPSTSSPRWLPLSPGSNLATRATLLLLLFALHPNPIHAATQVGSAPYQASSTGAGNSYAPVFSPDGQHIAFVSHANNLATNDDLAPHLDLFVRDLVTSNTVLVSVSTNGFGGANDNIWLYTLSSNAQVVAFETLANNLAPGDANRWSDIYVRDLATGVTRLITPGANGPSSNPLISEDGRRVIFESLASNLVTNDFNGTNDIFIHDLTTGVTELVTLNTSSSASPDGPSHSPAISADGLTIAFVSHATNLVEGVTNTFGEVYARNVAERNTRWAMASQVPRTYAKLQGISTYRASKPTVSRDGKFVSFRTQGAFVRFDLQSETNYTRIAYTNLFTLDGVRIDIFEFADNPRVSLQFPLPFTTTTLLQDSALNKLFLDLDSRRLIYPELTQWYQTMTGEVPYLGRLEWDSIATNIYLTSIVGPSGALISSYVTNVGPAASRIWTNSFGPAGSPLWTNSPWLWLGSDQEGRRIVVNGEIPINLTNPDNLSPRRTQLVSIDTLDGSLQLLCTNGSGFGGINLSASVPALHPVQGVAWDCADPTLTEGDLNRSSDVFVRNLDTGETTLVSARHPDMPATSGLASSRIAGRQSLSADGSKIVVLTHDSDLTADDTNRLADAALRDLRTGTNTMVSGPFVAPLFYGSTILATVPPTNHVSFSAISANGKQIVYVGQAFDPLFNGGLGHTNLNWRDLESNASVRGVAPAVGNVAMSLDGRLAAYYAYTYEPGLRLLDFRHSRPSNTLFSFSRNSRTQNANGPSINPVFSPDSRWIAFQSLATDLTYDPDQIAGYHQLYVREIDGTLIKRISYDSVLQTNVYPLPGGATNPVFSADARFVFFDGATNRTIYRHDLLNDMNDAGTERRLNLVACTACANPSPSSDGRLVAYESCPAPGGITNIFLKDLDSGAVELVSVSLTGTNGNGSAFTPLLSHDARYVVFASRASDLVPGDNNRATDIFVRDRWAGATHSLSRNVAGTGTGNRLSSNPILSADGRTVAFQSFASDLVAGDYNDTRDVFVVTLGGPDTDGDGIEDDWELAYFNTLARDGSADFDGDGASDRDEFRAGSNPANNASTLRILRLTTSVSAGQSPTRTTRIIWMSTPGRTYRVETKNDLTAPWSVIGDITATSLSATATHALEYPQDGPEPAWYYRVTLVP